MAYYRKQRGQWRAEIEKLGVRMSASFASKAEAVNWATREEAAIVAAGRGMHPRKTLADAIDRYVADVSVKKAGARFEGLRLAAFVRDFPALAGKVLGEIQTPDLVRWRDARLKVVTPGSVQRDINLLRNVFSVARDEWHWCSHAPFKGMKMPGENSARKRRIPWQEVRRIVRWLGYRTGRAPVTKQQELAVAFLVALRTAMREGEIAGLTPGAIDLHTRVVTLSDHKTRHMTGEARKVPIRPAAARLLALVADRDPTFSLSADGISTGFRKAVAALLIDDLHFHDSRAEALTLLARKVDVMTLARISGHRDLKMLLDHYYRETEEDIAKRLR